MADEAKPLDAEAAQDLGDAQHEAEQAAGHPEQPPGEMQAAQNGVRQDLAQASAELAARQQQIAAELAQAQAEAQGEPRRPDTSPATNRAKPNPGKSRDVRSVRHRASQGAKKMGPGGPASPDRKEPRWAGPPQGAVVCQPAPRGPRHHAQQCPTPSSARIRTADPRVFRKPRSDSYNPTKHRTHHDK